MVRNIKEFKKNKPTRERKVLVIVGTEGKNKTEQLYLKEFEKTQRKYHFIFTKGDDTDPENIVKNTIKMLKKEDIDKKSDIAISVFDMDFGEERKEQFLKAKKIAEKSKIMLITSNPCFEIWFLLHFEYSTKQFTSSDDLLSTLRKFDKDYAKNKCNFLIYKNLINEAVENCKKLDKYHLENSNNSNIEFNNPRTDMYKLIEKLLRN